MLARTLKDAATQARRSPAYVVLNLALMGSWLWFASDQLPIPLAALLALCAGGGQLALRRLAENGARPEAHASGGRFAALLSLSSAGRLHALNDESTGLYNRWYLERRLEEEAERCQRFDHPMAVVVVRAGLVDLPDMSNDDWQAKSADAAQRCQRIVRRVDLSAFLAPLEFAICLVHCDRAGAEAALARIKEELADYECEGGAAVFPDDECEPRALIEFARLRSRMADVP